MRVCYFVLPTGGGHDSSSGRLLFGARAAELSTQNAARRNSFVGDEEEIRGRFSSSRQRPHVPAYLRHKFAQGTRKGLTLFCHLDSQRTNVLFDGYLADLSNITSCVAIYGLMDAVETDIDLSIDSDSTDSTSIKRSHL